MDKILKEKDGHSANPVIFLHGLGQTSASWKETVSGLPENIKTYCPDLLKLSKKRSITYERIYRVFEHTANGLEGPVNLCGISLGAVLALHYAIKNPKNAGGLILIAPQYKMPRLLLSVQNVIFKILPQRAFSGIGKRDMMSVTNSMKTLDFTSELTKVSCPVLIICGQKDKANKKAAMELADKIPDVRLMIFENAGHEVNVDAATKLAEVIKGWIL